jgi:putative endonuclease
MFYVYCVVRIANPNQRYIGFSENVRQRVLDHNNGCNPSTAPFKPWRLKGYVAFDSEPAARAFERYLKSGSGHAFRNKRLW